MTGRSLLKLLSSLPPEVLDLPIATHANHHTYSSYFDSGSHGPCRVVLMGNEKCPRIGIGNISENWQKDGNDDVLKSLDGGWKAAWEADRQEWPGIAAQYAAHEESSTS